MHLLKRIYGYITAVGQKMDERNLSLIAAGVAFYAMLALFPALAATIALWGFFSDPAIINEQLAMLRRFVPEQAYILLEGQVRALITANDSTLGWATLASFAATLWSARAGVAALIRGLNTVHGARSRNSMRAIVTAITLTITLVLIAIFALGMIVVFPIALNFLPLGALATYSLDALRWIIIIGVVNFGLGVLYRYGPNRGKDRSGWFTSGAILAVVIWAAVSVAFSVYLSNFGNYNEVYGSIGAVIALLMWFYISAWVIFLGAALNVEISRMREKKRNLRASSQVSGSQVSGDAYKAREMADNI